VEVSKAEANKPLIDIVAVALVGLPKTLWEYLPYFHKNINNDMTLIKTS
jgi:hypothetical protein